MEESPSTIAAYWPWIVVSLVGLVGAVVAIGGRSRRHRSSGRRHRHHRHRHQHHRREADTDSAKY